MNNWLSVFAILAAMIAAGAFFYERWQMRKTFDVLERMLSAAIAGDFSDRQFDESRLSKIEAAFARYLNDSVVSHRATVREKEKIRTLIADISHQTKTPITNLLLYSELLRESNLDEVQRESADAIYQESGKLSFLIESLIKLSRLDNGIIRLSPHREQVGNVLRAVYEEMLPKASAKGLCLILREGDAAAVFDAKWTAEALGNITDNAIKYTEKGAVSLSCEEYDLFTRIDVADTGIGIPEEEQPRIFRRFYRSEEVAKEPGVGIGLYLAREIIGAENGYIKVASAPGEGSVFSVFLPRS